MNLDNFIKIITFIAAVIITGYILISSISDAIKVNKESLEQLPSIKESESIDDYITTLEEQIIIEEGLVE